MAWQERTVEIMREEFVKRALNTRTAASKNGVLEQIGRMRVQDGFSDGDCIYIANLAADAVNGGFTSREVERTIRAIRLAFKAKDAHTDDPYYADLAARAVDMLRRMAAYETKGAAND